MTLAKEAAPLLRPLITTKGLTAAVQASTLGKAVKIVKVGLTARPGVGAVGDTSLPDAVLVNVADGRLVNDHQVNVSALLTDTFPSMDIAGIAFYLEDGTMFAVYREERAFLEHTNGTTLLVGMDLVMDNIPSDSVTVESTGANLILGDWVPVFRRVNGRALTADIMLTAADVNAAPSGFGIGGDGGNLPDADCNKAVANGMYRVQSAAFNTPYGQGPTGSRLLVSSWNKDYCSQIFFRALTNEMWTRGTVITNGVTSWRPWTQVYTTEFQPSVDLSGYVPTARKVNGKALSVDITLTPEDIKAAPASHSHSNYVPTSRKVNNKALDADITLTPDDVKAAPASHSHSNYVPNTRRVNNKPLSEDVSITAPELGINNVGLAGFSVNISELEITDLNKINKSGHYYTTNPSDTNRPSTAAGPIVHVQGAAGFQQYVRDNVLMFRGFTGATFQPWQTVFHTGNLPTPAQIGSYTIAQIDNALMAQTPATALAIAGGVDLNTFMSAGIWYQGSNVQASSGVNYPVDQAGVLLVYKTAGVRQVYHVYGQNLSYTRAYYEGRWTGWSKIYNTATPPTAEEVGAVSLSGDETKKGQLVIQRNSLPLALRSTTPGVGEANYLLGQDSAGTSRWYVGQANAGNSTAVFHCYTTNTNIQLATDAVIASRTLRDNSGTTFTTGRLPTAAQSNHDVINGAFEAVGSYVLACVVSGGLPAHGNTVYGSNLRPSSCWEYGHSGKALSGTWRCMGDVTKGNNDGVLDDQTTLFIRIA
ncbi:MAG: pyocin knob domain-containing protein [Aeromonas sobria]|uniref:pyocin knob domain-containing protein n=1 Tax=Aeromonas sobria TaxID=646 RepID=UPI003F2D99F8